MKKIIAATFLFLLTAKRVDADGGNFTPLPTLTPQASTSTPTIQNIGEKCITLGKNLGIQDTLQYILSNLFWAALGAIIGSIIALRLAKYQNPSLEISAGEFANSDNRYPSNHIFPGQRWKFFRVSVKNKPIPKFLSWLLDRETAQEISARITIEELGRTYKGRWAGTLELPYASQLDIARLANFPEPVTLIAGEIEHLDIFTKNENDNEAYGWNNESYLHNWRNPNYLMTPGDYRIIVQVTTVTGNQKRKILRAHIETSIDNTYLVEDNG